MRSNGLELDIEPAKWPIGMAVEFPGLPRTRSAGGCAARIGTKTVPSQSVPIWKDQMTCLPRPARREHCRRSWRGSNGAERSFRFRPQSFREAIFRRFLRQRLTIIGSGAAQCACGLGHPAIAAHGLGASGAAGRAARHGLRFKVQANMGPNPSRSGRLSCAYAQADSGAA